MEYRTKYSLKGRGAMFNEAVKQMDDYISDPVVCTSKHTALNLFFIKILYLFREINAMVSSNQNVSSLKPSMMWKYRWA